MQRTLFLGGPLNFQIELKPIEIDPLTRKPKALLAPWQPTAGLKFTDAAAHLYEPLFDRLTSAGVWIFVAPELRAKPVGELLWDDMVAAHPLENFAAREDHLSSYNLPSLPAGYIYHWQPYQQIVRDGRVLAMRHRFDVVRVDVG